MGARLASLLAGVGLLVVACQPAQGLEVQLDNSVSSTGIPALLSGQVQVAQLGGSETLSAAVGGGDLVIIGIIGWMRRSSRAPWSDTSAGHKRRGL